MTGKELILALADFDDDLPVWYDYDGGFSTMPIDKVTLEHQYYDDERGKGVVIY